MSTEHVVAKVDALKDGQMKEVKAGETSILLVRFDGEYRALGAACPHQGAPLAEGLLHGGRIRCPWHLAAFEAATGRLVEPPPLDALPQFDLRIEGEHVIVSLPDEVPEACTPAMATPDPEADGRTFAILGAGAAGLTAAETLRQEGFRGRIVMITREAHLPYDRTDLSKRYLRSAKAKPTFFRSKEFYDTHGIELLACSEVVEVEVPAKMLRFADGSQLGYDRLLLATGATPRRLNVPGADLDNVLVLRGMDDCDRIRGVLEGATRAVVVGASFLGMEAGAGLAKRGLSVTVVAPEPVPLARVFGDRIGHMLQKLHEEKGVAFRLGSTVERIEGDGKVRAVVLAGGERLEADLVVVGIGVRPATDFLKGIETHDDGSVTVDEYMRACKDVYAAGDIARFPDWRTGVPIRIEHWRLAQQHGRVAARNMAGRETPYRGVPFFWTEQFMTIIEYVGHAREWDEIAFDGAPDDGRFVAYYVKGSRVLAAASRDQSRKTCLIAELLQAKDPPTVDQIRRQWAGAESLMEA